MRSRCISGFLDVFLIGGSSDTGLRSELVRIYASTVRSLEVTSKIGTPGRSEAAGNTQTLVDGEQGATTLCHNNGLECHRFTTSSRRWTPITGRRHGVDLEYSAQAVAPEVAAGHGGVGGAVWVTGGGMRTASADTVLLWPDGTTADGPLLPEPLRGHTLTLVQRTRRYNYYVLTGGTNASGKVSGHTYLGRLRRNGNATLSLLLYWRRMSDLANPRYSHFALLHGKVVHVCGGMSWVASGGMGSSVPVHGCEALDLVAKTGRWQEVSAPGLAPLASPCVLAAGRDEETFVFGGLVWSRQRWRLSEEVLVFDGTGFTTLLGGLEHPRQGCHASKAAMLGLKFPTHRWEKLHPV